MNFRQITETFKRVAQQYQEDTRVAVDYIRAQDLTNRLKDNGINTDARDFVPLVTMMGIQGDSPEERAQDIRNKIDELTEAFSSKDPARRVKYLDMIYDLVDNFDLATVDMDNEKQVGQLLQCLLVDQAFGEKKNENPEYFNKRYNTIAANALVTAQDRFRTAAAPYINDNLRQIQTPLHSIASLPQRPNYMPENIQVARLAFARIQRDQALAAKESGQPISTLEVPVLDEIAPLAGKTIADVRTYDKATADTLQFYFAFVIEESLIRFESKSLEGFREAGIHKGSDTLYVDGMPYADFVQKNFPGVDNNDLLTSKLLSTILLNDSHQVDMVHAYRNDEGVMQYEAKTLKAALTPQQQEQKQQAQNDYLNQFSWFRRTFFNWGPFRILPKPVDPNGPEAAARHAKVCAHIRGALEPMIAAREESARQSELEKQQKALRDNAIKKERDRFDNTVDLWEKDSVIGILGQQVKGSHANIYYQLFASPEKDRFANTINLLAAQVLYSQLMLERTLSNGGPIGPIEQGLLGDGKPETIQQNIQNSIRNIAEDPVLKDLYTQKVSDHRGTLSPDKFNDLTLSGGCEHFAMDYLQMKNKLNEMEQIAKNSPQLENQQNKEMENNVPQEQNVLGGMN